VADGLLLAAVTNTVQAFDGPNGLPSPPMPDERPGLARDVGVGADGSVWVVGANATAGGFGIYRWNGSGWIEARGGAERISFVPSGNPWVDNADHRICHWNGSGWVPWAGAANDVGVGAGGSVWVVGTNRIAGGFGIYRWNG